MTVKIFLPKETFSFKENHHIYGEIRFNDCHAISYYIITTKAISTTTFTTASSIKYDDILQENESYPNLRHLGFIVNEADMHEFSKNDVALIFAYSTQTSHIYIKKLNIKFDTESSINIFLYNEREILKLQESEDEHEASNFSDDITMLYQLLKQKQQFRKKNSQSRSTIPSAILLIIKMYNLPIKFLNILFTYCINIQPFKFIFKRTILYEHYEEWLKFKNIGKRSLNILIDKLLGISVMFLLLFYLSNSGNYLIEGSHFVIYQLRMLLQSLKGSPIGIKLNIQLNSFLLDCFGYHVDLWAPFLDLIEPIIKQLFIPLALLGSMGLTYQLALLADLVSVVGLHAHCFSIYSAVLYKVELNGLQVLWKMVLGKRKNLLKNRVESHNYKNRQLYLATLFFTTLLFLFPTILTYYVVFTTLRLCIFAFNVILRLVRRHLLEFPFELLARWCFGNFSDIEAVKLEHYGVSPTTATTTLIPELNPKMFIFVLEIQPSPLSRVFSRPSGVLQELKAQKENSIKEIFRRILYGTL